MRWRRLTSSSALGVWALGALAYLPALVAAPGKMPSDTKLYLYLDPGRLISDASYTWDNRQFAGWVPHQTVTYLWPSGPWFWLFEHLGFPDWIAHRLWIGSLLFAGGLGVRWAAKHLGLPIAGALVAAVVYQLSPYVLPYLSRTSLMLLPWAGVGWLVGLTVRAATRGTWRDAAIFGLVIFTVGSPNATALAMIAPAPVLWLVHAAWQRSITWRRAVTTAVRIGALSLVVSLWWIAMMTVQAAHGADVLAYSETLEAVSFTSVSTEALRGLGYWLFYIRDPSGFATSASRPYMEVAPLIMVSFALVLCCFAGIALTRWSHRRYAALLVFAGIILAVGVHPIAHPSPVMSRLATSSRSTLSLAIRSSTRALPVSNFGLALGAGALATAAAPILARRRASLAVLAPLMLVLLAVANLPALFDRGFVDPALTRDQNPPAAWRSAAAALDSGSSEHRVMQLPGAEFGAFRWGYTVDPPLPGLTSKPLITRDLLPLGSAGAMDLLDALDDRAQSGTLEPASIAPLARLFGVDTIWLANDMAFERFRTPRPELTHELFGAGVPGLGAPQPYGDAQPNVPTLAMVDESQLAHHYIGEPLPPVELVPVHDPVAMVRATDRVVLLVGSGDGVVDASAAGLLQGSEAVLYAADRARTEPRPPDAVILTDSNRDRAHQWRGSQDVVGFTETGGAGADVLTQDPADQRLPVFPTETASDQTTAHVEGLDVRATGYGEPFAYRPEDRPAMAVDGNPATAWVVADRANPIGQYIEIRGPVPSLSLLQSQQLGASRMITSVRIDFDNGASQDVGLDESSLVPPGQPIQTPPAATMARITITGVGERPGATDPGPSAVGFAELGVGTHDEVVSLPTNLPAVPDGAELSIVLTRLRTDPLDRWRSDPEPRLLRQFDVPAARDMDLTVTLHRNDRAPDAVLNSMAGVDTATADRRLTGDPSAGGSAAIDGNPQTAWTSPFSNAVGSTLRIPLDPATALTSLDIVQPGDAVHSTITHVAVTVGERTIGLEVPTPDTNGRSTITMPAMTAMTGDELTITVDGIDAGTTVDRRYGEPTVLPVAISELSAPAIRGPRPTTPDPECRADLLQLDGHPVPLRVDAEALAALNGGKSVDVHPCDPTAAALSVGGHRLASAAGAQTGIDVDRVVWKSAAQNVAATSAPTVKVQRTRTTRTATVSDCPTGCWLILGEGYNDGWSASLDGHSLGAPRQIAGGFNGWWLTGSATARTVTMRWTPQGTMWAGMVIAGLGVLGCIALLWLDRRRRRGPADALVHDVPTLAWPQSTSRRRAALVGLVLVALTAITVAPAYAAIALVVAAVVVLFRRPGLAGIASIGIVAGVALLVVRRQLRYHLQANPSWPAAFDDLHRLGLLAVVLLLVATVTDEPVPDRTEADVTEPVT